MKWEPIEGEKQCSKCRERKPLSAFSASRTGVNGRHAYCRVCRNKYARDRAAVRGWRPGKPLRRRNKPEAWPRPLDQAQLDALATAWPALLPVSAGTFAPHVGRRVA